MIPVLDLVPGDVVQLSVGVVVPGDVRIIEGSGMPEVPHLSTPHVFVEWAAYFGEGAFVIYRAVNP